MLVGKRLGLDLPAGVNKNDNSYSSLQWSDADKVRFFKHYPQKIGGWTQVAPNIGINQQIKGSVRTLFTWQGTNNLENLLIGTSYGLYVYKASRLYNITPLEITPISLTTDPLSSFYQTLTNNPLSVSNGSSLITMDVSAFSDIGIFQAGDSIKITGSSALGNIPAIQINTTHAIIDVNTTTITFLVSTIADNNYTGGGASVDVATQVIRVDAPANGLNNGDRVKIDGATGFNGFLAGNLNIESIVRNVTTNTFDYYAFSTNYSNAAGSGGGSAVDLYEQISAGNDTFQNAFGYGGGLYGQGYNDDSGQYIPSLYGRGAEFTNGYLTPQIWSFDIFGQSIIMNRGNGTPIYQWLGNTNTAPTPLTLGSAPQQVNYIFTSHGEAVALGAGNIPNAIWTSDTADLGNWVPAADTNAFRAEVSGAGRFIGYGFVKDQDVLFTSNAVYSLNYVGKPILWEVRKISESDGAIAPKAIVSVNDMVFWMGFNDMYAYNGATYTAIPNNTVKNWIYQNINWGKSYLSFIRSCLEFNEIWFFFPFGDSPEPNAYAIYNFDEGVFTNGFLTRTASEEPANQDKPQYMAVSSTPFTLSTNPIIVFAGSTNALVELPNEIQEVFNVNMYITIAGVSGSIGGLSADNFNRTFRITAKTQNVNGTFLTISLPVAAVTSQKNGGNTSTISIASNIYQHEVDYGDGDINTPFEARIETNYAIIGEGDYMQEISRIVPSTDILYDARDLTSDTELYNITIQTKEYDGNAFQRSFGAFPISLGTNKVDVRANGRQRKYIFSSNTHYPFRLQKWYEEVRQTTVR